MERFIGQTAVVTGASGGIASEITKALLKKAVNVVGLDKHFEKLKELEEEFSQNNKVYIGTFYPKKCDLLDDHQIRETFDWIGANFKSVSILINGAGVSIKTDINIRGLNAEDFDTTIGVNAKGTVLCCKEALNLMMSTSVPGHIINICSALGKATYTNRGCPLYAISKHSVRVFSDILRHEINRKRANIKVTNMSPGPVNTILLTSRLNYDFERTEILDPEDVANGCISVLSTPPHVLISEYTIEPVHTIEVADNAVENILF